MALERKIVTDRQSELNQATRGQWTLFASHRKRVEQLLDSAIPRAHSLLPGGGQRQPRLCVVGAGNCNDLDLRFLARRFAEIHLIDIDAAALAGAVQRQNVAAVSHIHRHAPIDLAGLTGTFDRWLDDIPTTGEIEEAIKLATGTPAPNVPGPFDVVLSSCVLSQLISPARDRLGADHKMLPALRNAIVRRHLRLLLDMLAPGGTAVFVSDVVSSDTEPGLPRVRDDALPDMMRRLVERRRTFRGLDPGAISVALEGGLHTHSRIATRQWIAPWLWHISPRRTYLVYGLLLGAPPAVW
jgi:hypothetical protein